jgi:aspartate/methionine/tyrosine aminotransferase
MDSINKNLLDAQYSLRGELTLRTEQLKKILRENPESLPFSRIINCSLGDPQQFSCQQPLIYLRQISALLELPQLLLAEEKESDVSKLFPLEVIHKARELGKEIKIGPYSNSKGVEYIRKLVAKFIKKRDGGEFESDHENIFLTNGASAGIYAVLNMLICQGKKSGIMVPVPEYPLYSASITLFGGEVVLYPLAEHENWSLDMQQVLKTFENACQRGIKIAAFVVINPGNPTGNMLSPQVQRKIVEFCSEKQIPLLADEVYQENVYSAPFVSFKRVASEFVRETGKNIQLYSFHSVSKGFLGECGRRGGYLECFGVPSAFINSLYKYQSFNLSPNMAGQLAVAVMVDPPTNSINSSEAAVIWQEQREKTISAYAKKAKILQEGFSQLPGVECGPISGALYIFPKFFLPKAAIEAASKVGKEADEFYCLRLLNSCGICILPGTCFGQPPGTFHFRLTILPSEEELKDLLEKIKVFHLAFLAEYSSNSA